MEGQNEMHLNSATMKAAIQYWLTNQVFNVNNYSPTVESVRYDSQESQFVVLLKSEQPK